MGELEKFAARGRAAQAAVDRLTAAKDLNEALHRLLGVSAPCQNACTHVVWGTWTALGLANVATRAEAVEPHKEQFPEDVALDVVKRMVVGIRDGEARLLTGMVMAALKYRSLQEERDSLRAENERMSAAMKDEE